MSSVPSGTVCILGAGGPMGSSIIGALARHYTLRLADRLSEREVRARPLMKGAPEHPHLGSPHEWVRVDVTDYRSVEAAVAGCDAVVNLTVNRSDVAAAFRVNLGGAWNVMLACAGSGVRRVIHTGPVNVAGMSFQGDYRHEFGIDEAAPMRPGADLYSLTKHLSYDLVDQLAAAHGIDTMTLLVSRLRQADERDGRDHDVVIPFSTAWSDLASAFRAALVAPALPQPNERFFICADLPMGKYSPAKAARLLGWQARERFDRFLHLPGGSDGSNS